MNRRPKTWMAVLAAALAVCSMAAWAAEPQPIAGKVVAVTLYRGQALVTRTVPVDKPAGQVELLVGDLPQQVVPDSLFAEAGPGLEVRAVRYGTRAVSKEPRPEVRKLKDDIEGVEQQISRNKKMQDLVRQRLAFLTSLEGFAAPTAKVELSKGVLDVETLTKLTRFAFDERQKATEETLKLDDEARGLAKQLALLKRQLAKLTAKSSPTVREALVFLEKRGGDPGEIKLSYLVRGSGWSPAYNFRTNADRTKLDVEYNAIIQQMSGEDWSDVKLTLSTASPALSAEGPGLAPFRIALAQRKGKPRELDVLSGAKASRQRLHRAYADQRKAQALRPNRDANWKMNAAANEFQNYELVAGKDVFQALQTEAAEQGPSVSYPLADPVSLASRSDQQTLRIVKTRLGTNFYYVASPILTSYVYREAKVENTGAEVLLAGPVSVYLDGRFVGRGEVPTVARGESFVMGFGADPQLRARRERIDRAERVQGGNREIDVKYRITLENFKDVPAIVRVFDRQPVSERDTDVRVTLAPMDKDKLSTDKLYERVAKPKGILRWDIEVAAGAAGEKARLLEYGYKLEFDRNLALVNPSGAAAAAAMQEEFNKLQMDLQNR